MRVLLPLLVTLSPCVVAQCPRGTLRSPVPTEYDLFGRRVSLSGDLALVSRWGDVGFGGPVHVFDLAAGQVEPATTLLPPTADTWTGWSHVLRGDLALLSGQGQAYLFDARTGNLRQVFQPNGPSFSFGIILALDDQYAYVGSYDDEDATGGLVYVFDLMTGAIVRKLDTGLGLPNLNFGYSLAADNGRLLVGAPGPATPGQAFLFDVASGALLRTFTPTIAGELDFGGYVALEGDRALVCGVEDLYKQRTHLFDTTTGAELALIKSKELLYDIELENGRAYIGAALANQLVRVVDAANGTMLDPLYAPIDEPMRFGQDIAVSGNRILIGAPEFDAPLTSTGAAFLFDLCAEIGSAYCGPAVPNSTGLPGRLRAFGSDVVADGDLLLRADQLPANRIAFGLVSQTQGFTMPPGSDGNLCLAGLIGRDGPTTVSNHGHVDLPLNLAALPGGQAVQPGETWNFQVWHRDVGQSSNLTEGLTVLFQ